MGLNQMDMDSIFPCYHKHSSSFLYYGRFDIFFPGIYDWKKKRQINLILSTNQGKNQSCFRFIEVYLDTIFFPVNPVEKKIL